MANRLLEMMRAGGTFTPTTLARSLCKNPSTVWRWIQKGILVRGKRVRLEAIRVGGRRLITTHAFNEFLVSISSEPEQPDPLLREPAPDTREAAARKLCEEMGL